MRRVHGSCEHDTQTGPTPAALQLTAGTTEGISKDVYIKDSLSLVEWLIAGLLNELFIPGID